MNQNSKMQIKKLFQLVKIAFVALCVLLAISANSSVFAQETVKAERTLKQECESKTTDAAINDCYRKQWKKVTEEKVNLISGAEAPLTVAGQSHNLNLKKTLEDVIDALIMIIGTAALAFIIFAGFRLVTAAGDENSITRAKDMLKQTVIGFALALLAYVIVGVWQGFLFR